MKKSKLARHVLITNLLAIGLFASTGYNLAYSDESIKDNNDCITEKEETTPSKSFTSRNNGSIVYHEETGLEWMRCPTGMTWDGGACDGNPSKYTWSESRRLAEVTGADWRIPTIEELQGIVEECQNKPAINLNVFPDTPSNFFWSYDTGGSFSDTAKGIYFLYGSEGTKPKSKKANVRLVRNR